MGRSQETFNKKEKEKKRQKKREEKRLKRQERKEKPTATEEDMIAYVDEFGNPTDTPPDPTKVKKVKAEDIDITVPKREEEDIDPIHKGIVDFFNTDKGFGFIREPETGEKYFVHISELVDEVKEGNQVEYELAKGPKGLNAVNVKIKK